MKKGILIAIVGIIIIGITYFGIEMYGFVKGVKEDMKKNIVTEKTELSDYKNSELSSFYKDFENEITEIIWTDEPPAKLYGVIFIVSDTKYYEIELDSIPELYKVNFKLNWKMTDVGKSKIRNIKLIEEEEE